MASKKIQGITIEIAGNTSQLSKDLKQLDTQSSRTSAAIREIDRALQLDPSNIELANQRMNLLSEEVSQTEQRLRILKETAELANSALAKGDIALADYASLQAEISRTEQALKGMKNEAEFSAEEIEDLGEEAVEAGDKVESSSVSFENLGNTAKVAGEIAVASIVALTTAAVALVSGLVDASVQAAAFADEVLTTSTVTGISTEALQGYMYAAELVDVELNTLTSSMARNIRSMNSAAEGSSQYAEAYEALGISVTDANGNLRDSQEVYWEMIDALGEIENETERDALAMELLGRSAQELNPLIEAGSERMQELASEAQEAGYVMSDETLDSFGEFDDALQYLDVGATAAENALGTILLPVLTSIAQEGSSLLGEFTNALLDADGNLEEFPEIIGQFLPQVVNLIFDYLPILIETAGTIIGALAEGLISNLDLILEQAMFIVSSLGIGLLEALPSLVPVALDLVNGLCTFLVDNTEFIINTAIELVLALATGLSDSAQDLIPAVVTIILTILDALIDHYDELVIAAIDLAMGIFTGLIEAIPQILGAIPEIVFSIIQAMQDLGPSLASSALEWGVDLVDGFIDGIESMISSVASTAEEIASTVWEYLHFSEPEKGPLSNFHTFAPDMVDLWNEGIESNLGQVEATMNTFGQVIATGATESYSSDISSISSGIGSLADSLGRGQTIMIPVYIGSEQIDSIIVNASRMNNFQTGGR